MFLADVAALADYYGGLPHVAEVINRKFNRCGSGSCLWQDVMDEPAFYLGLATMLRNYELFADAMKHFAGRSECFIDLCSGQNPGNIRHEEDLPAKVTGLAIQKNQEILNRVRNMNNTLQDALNGFGRSHSSIYPKDPNVPLHKKNAVRRARELAVKDSLNEYLEGYFSGRGWPSDGHSAVCIGGAAPFLDLDVTLEKATRTRGYEFLGKHRRWIINGELGHPK